MNTEKKIKKEKRFNLKQFIKDHAEGIAIGTTWTITVAAIAIWIMHVKRNTIDLEKPVVPGVNVLEFYEQFGDRNLWAETDLETLPEFVRKILDNEMLPKDTKVFIEAYTSNK